MKKLSLLFFMFMLCLCGMGAETETTLLEANRIYVTGEKAYAGSTAELLLNMKNRNAITIWSCTLVLPAGVTFNKIEAYELESRYPDGYNPVIATTTNADGSVNFTCSGASDDVSIFGKDGPVAVVTVEIASTVAPGEYNVTIQNSKVIETDGFTYSFPNEDERNNFSWAIEEAPVTYGTITFDLHGAVDATGAPLVIEPITVPVGEAIDAPNDPEWEGHKFNGWYPEIPETMPEGGINVVAQWELIKYQVSIETEPKDGVTISDMNPEYGSSVTITVNEVPDQVFESLWINQEDVTARMTGNTYVIDNVTGDISVCAYFRSTVEIIVPSQEYTPFSCSQDLDFTNSELKAYIASGFNKATNQVILVRAKEVPAYTGVLLIGVPGTTYKIPYNETNSFYSSIFVPCIQGGLVTATDENVGSVNYIFDVVDNDPGFYPVSTYPAEVYLPEKSAYLALPANFVQASAGVKIGVIIEEDVIDGIADVQLNANQTIIYDLQGRRVAKANKGIYVVNGKKVAFK